MQTTSEQLEAVIFFEEGKIAREMQYPEFEAVMDGYVPMADYAGGKAQAVYIRVNSQFKITACVFFLVEFGERGMIAPRWNVPVQRLAESASHGPNLGAGPIRLACFSQCPMQWLQNNLWDPGMEPGRNSFVLMKKSVAANRLGLIFRETKASPTKEPQDPASEEALRRTLEREYAKTMRSRLAQTLKNQRLRINTLNSRLQLKIDSLKREHQHRLAGLQASMSSIQINNQTLEQEKAALQQELDLQQRKAESIREYFEHKLKNAQSDEGAQMETLEESMRREFEEKLSDSRRELQQQLDMRDMELFYRQQRESTLTDELDKLRNSHEALLNNGADQLLLKLQDAGVSFVAYEPGAGQMTLPAAGISDYVSNPTAFAAEKCGVTEALYKQWLDHYHSPYCNAVNGEGEECGAGVTRVVNPSDFHDGESNRCDEHTQHGHNYQTQGQS